MYVYVVFNRKKKTNKLIQNANKKSNSIAMIVEKLMYITYK